MVTIADCIPDSAADPPETLVTSITIVSLASSNTSVVLDIVVLPDVDPAETVILVDTKL